MGMNKSDYEFGIVMFTMGNVFAELDRDSEFVYLDMDELMEIAESVYSDWLNHVDIRNQDEEGYIGVYAYRRLRNHFGITVISANVKSFRSVD